MDPIVSLYFSTIWTIGSNPGRANNAFIRARKRPCDLLKACQTQAFLFAAVPPQSLTAGQSRESRREHRPFSPAQRVATPYRLESPAGTRTVQPTRHVPGLQTVDCDTRVNFRQSEDAPRHTGTESGTATLEAIAAEDNIGFLLLSCALKVAANQQRAKVGLPETGSPTTRNPDGTAALKEIAAIRA